tara:strand:- start:779 stop:1744 length:966 start_codon:yes stop_codon:yes gene_type:complete
MSEPATLIISGLPVNVAETAIELITGWNWVGYLPQNPGSVGEALESVSEIAEFISSQSSGTATNYGAYGWYGSLEMLEPGNGYLLDMDSPGTLLYPEFNSLTRSLESKREITLSDNLSSWDFSYSSYEFVGTVHISIDNDQTSDNDLVGAFVNEECRGVAERIYFPFNDSYMFILQVYSNDLNGEELTFKYYNSSSDQIVHFTEKLHFENNMVIGDGFNTFSLLNEINDSYINPLIFGLNEAYPNPFNPVTSLKYTMEESGFVRILIYNVNGQVVSELINGYREVGMHTIEWNASKYSNGLYMVKMITEAGTSTLKVMLLK